MAQGTFTSLKKIKVKVSRKDRGDKKRGEIYVIWCEENHGEYISVRKNKEKLRKKDREPERKMTIYAKNKRGKDKIFTCMWY